MEYSHLITMTQKYSSLNGKINFPLIFKILTMYFARARMLDKIIHSLLMIRTIVSEREAGKRRQTLGFCHNNCLQLKAIYLKQKEKKKKKEKRKKKKRKKEKGKRKKVLDDSLLSSVPYVARFN